MNVSATRPTSSAPTMRSYPSSFLSKRSDGEKGEEPVKAYHTGRGGRGNIHKQKPKSKAPKSKALGSPNSPPRMSSDSVASSLSIPSTRSSIISISARHSDASSVRTFQTSSLSSSSDGSDSAEIPRHTGSDPPSSLLSSMSRSMHSLILRVPSSSSRPESPHSPPSPTVLSYTQSYDASLEEEEEEPEPDFGHTLGRECSAVLQGPKTRTGRGGAGNFMKTISKLDSGHFITPVRPRTSAIVEHAESNRVVLERNILEHSLVEGMLLFSSGRGGTGNIKDQRHPESKRRSRIIIRRKKNRNSTGSSSSKSSTSPTSDDHTAPSPSSPSSSKTAHERSSSPALPVSPPSEGATPALANGKANRRGLKRLFWRKATGQNRGVGDISLQEQIVPENIIIMGVQDTPIDINPEHEHDEQCLRPSMTIDTSDATIRTPQASPKLPPKVTLPETPSSASPYDNCYDNNCEAEGFEVIIEEEETEGFEVIIEEEEVDGDEEGDETFSTEEIRSPDSSVDEYDGNVTPLDELNDSEFLDVLISTFPTDFPINRDVIDDEDGVGVADYDPELCHPERRHNEVHLEEALSDTAKDAKPQSRARARAKSLSSLKQDGTVQYLRRPLPPIPVVRVSQHS